MRAKELNNRKLIVFASYEPSTKYGGGIANLSSLKVYSDFYQSVDYIYIGDAELRIDEALSNVLFYRIPLNQKKKWIRFILGFYYNLPAVCVSFASRKIKKEVYRQIAEILRKECDNNRIHVIFEDLPISSLMMSLKNKYPHWKYAIRSHNVLSSIFRGFSNDNRSSSMLRLAMKIESHKNYIYEKRMINFADKVWAISEEDSANYWNTYNFRCDGVFSIEYCNQAFEDVEVGDIKKIIHLGGLDLRKKDGMKAFITNAWDRIRIRFPDVELILGGKNSEVFNFPKKGIYGLGYVNDEVEFFSRGFIFINTQTVGSGVQLKSIIAVLAGKLLISTKMGVEGIFGENYKHYISVENWKDFEECIIKVLESSEHYKKIAKDGRQHFKEKYSYDNLYETASKLLINFQ